MRNRFFSIGLGLVLLSASGMANAVIIVPALGNTGWQTYSHTFATDFSGSIRVGASNYDDDFNSPIMLLDNFSSGANGGFESGDFSGYVLSGDGSVVSDSNGFNPTEGSLMAELIAAGADTTAFGGYDGSYLDLAISALAGDVLSFDWNFIATDYYPYEDFAFVALYDVNENQIHFEQLARIPEPSSLALLAAGLLGAAGVRKRRAGRQLN